MTSCAVVSLAMAASVRNAATANQNRTRAAHHSVACARQFFRVQLRLAGCSLGRRVSGMSLTTFATATIFVFTYTGIALGRRAHMGSAPACKADRAAVI